MKIQPTPETIWSRPAYLPYVQAKLTDETLREAERQLGCTLPNAYVELLRVQNGGPIRFRIPDSLGSAIAGIGPNFPSITDDDLKSGQDCVDFSLDGLVPFDGDGHWFLCLDYRTGAKEPAVSYIDVECNSQHLKAESFAAYLNLMMLHVQNEHVLQGVKDIDDAQKRLQAVFGIAFEREINNNGIPIWTASVGKAVDECLWISANQVAHGYSWDESGPCEFEGETLLFPELPAETVFFETPEERMSEYREKLERAGLQLVAIEDACVAR